MAKRLRTQFLLVILLLAVLSFMPYQIAARPNYGFAYLRRDPLGMSSQLVTIDPHSTNKALGIRPFPLPMGWNNAWIAASPTPNPKGDWLAAFLYAEDNSRLSLQLFNLVTGEIRSIIEGHIHIEGRDIAWSPDGKYLAGIVMDDTNDADLWVYSIGDSTLRNFTKDGCDQRDLTWSADSRTIFTFMSTWLVGSQCEYESRLETFDVETGKSINFIDLTPLPIPIGTCNPVVSPDGSTVSLTSNCGQSDLITPQYSSEIYIWDIQAATLRQLSHYADDMDGKQFYGNYSYQWLDSTTLFVGADYHIVGEPLRHELSIYQVDTAKRTLLSTAFGHHSILSPTMHAIALSSSVKDDPNNFVPSATNVQGSSVSIDAAGNFKFGSEGQSMKLGVICDVQWSPDGVVAAYHWVDHTYCQDNGYKVTFINQNGEFVGEFSSDSAAPATTIPIGWLPVTP